ncbi:hypothetical protein BE04_07895 [Sorangium cellulosum]|uniref:Secreted protein n=2 Tax=Sorangium cellulosum TaxID=56 RepID=A0A150PMA6_SORCE|nr:hypothetical protein [Sorangium cellulosum]AGP39837.1 hypothetical protein SCE1572_38300 [Sorangium cellulosum So0157-2]KYF56851.1 hypothetical protein BE04_07895 [Sorangium cellulosum]
MHGRRYCEGHLARVAIGMAGGSAFASLAVAAAAVLAASPAAADEPRSATEPRLMMETGELTSVVDAFDEGDTFDLNFSFGFEHASKSAKIRRETHIAAPGLSTGGYTSNLLNVASYSEATSKFNMRLDVGLYRDLALYLRMPLILNHSRELTGLDGSADHQSVVLAGAPGEQLFSLPFKSPNRSGIEYLAVGLDVNIMNQARDRTKPTWLFGIEGRFPVSEAMHACTESPKSGQVKCADPTDINRNGNADGGFEGARTAQREPGISRGTIGLEVHTYLSKRIKYVEPYGGFKALFEFQQESSDYGLTDLKTSLVNHPPLVGNVMLGVMIIPWENREKFTGLTFDLRFTGEYHSEGRDYSELFDALGSSDAPTLRQPQWAAFRENDAYSVSACRGGDPRACAPSVIDQGSQRTYFTGLSDVQPYGSYRASASVTWRAAELVKFQLGAGFRHDQGHGIGGDQPCNSQYKDSIGAAGPCRRQNNDGTFTVTGSPNPNYRPTINAVGRRFFVNDSNTFDLFASGTFMF